MKNFIKKHWDVFMGLSIAVLAAILGGLCGGLVLTEQSAVPHAVTISASGETTDPDAVYEVYKELREKLGKAEIKIESDKTKNLLKPAEYYSDLGDDFADEMWYKDRATGEALRYEIGSPIIRRNP